MNLYPSELCLLKKMNHFDSLYFEFLSDCNGNSVVWSISGFLIPLAHAKISDWLCTLEIFRWRAGCSLEQYRVVPNKTVGETAALKTIGVWDRSEYLQRICLCRTEENANWVYAQEVLWLLMKPCIRLHSGCSIYARCFFMFVKNIPAHTRCGCWVGQWVFKRF